MTFIIDTGSSDTPFAASWGRIGKCEVIRDAVADSLPAGAPQSAVDAATLAAILGDLYSPKVLETVREHFLQLWPLIADLGTRDPLAFDEIIVAYAELSQSLPANLSESIARRKASAQLR